jgi:hypothetical protein
MRQALKAFVEVLKKTDTILAIAKLVKGVVDKKRKCR